VVSRASDEGQNVGMARWPCTGEVKGEARYAYAPGRCPAVFLFGRMGHWNRDRDCESAQLTGCLLGGQASSLPSTEHRTPLRPLRGGVLLLDAHAGLPPGGGGAAGGGAGLARPVALAADDALRGGHRWASRCRSGS